MGKNILSIDDDEDILYTIQEIILHQGWTPLLARNFREAEHILTQYGNGRLDLILVDYHLPQPDGIQIVRRMREMGINVPIVVLTIEEQTAVMERFLEAGADDYAVKPIKPVDLVSRINTHLRYHEKEQFYSEADKGINQSTLEIIVSCLSCSEDYLDVGVIQRQTNLNPKTIHRYLRYLIREQMVEVKNTCTYLTLDRKSVK